MSKYNQILDTFIGPSSATSESEGKPSLDYTNEDVVRQQIEQQVDWQANQAAMRGESNPAAKMARSAPEKFGQLTPDQLQVLSIGLERIPNAQEQALALNDFYDNIVLTLRSNPQAFLKVLNSPGEKEIDRVLEMMATPGTPPKTLRRIMQEVKTDQQRQQAAPPRAMPRVGPAVGAGGRPTELQPLTTEQQELFHDNEVDIMNKAAAAGGWDAYTTTHPEDVMFVAQHRSDLPTIKAAAEGALRRAGHIT